jgi:pantetheine-phosphate adenylyltransferase
MKVAIYPGSFNPWHEGHTDVLNKALQIFDKVIIAVGMNPEKQVVGIAMGDFRLKLMETFGLDSFPLNVDTLAYSTLLVEAIPPEVCAVIKGLRNGQDLEYERAQQYWNEDLGLKIPTIYIITDRSLVHISSSAIRMVEKFK